jgi:hypothetical protein
MKLIDNSTGNYRFLTGIAPYSSGVVAMPGYELCHVRLARPIPYQQGFEVIEQHLAAQSRPRTALCAIELRSPRPFTFEGFAQFNQGYQQILADWNLLIDGLNPIARTNVAPAVGPPAEPVLYGFSYTMPTVNFAGPPTFVVAGAGELAEAALTPAAIVRPNETSSEAMREKAAFVMGVMQARLAGLEQSWNNVTTVDIYTIHPLEPFLTGAILNHMGPAAIHSIHWYYSRPPILGLEFEMDLRSVRQEMWLRGA